VTTPPPTPVPTVMLWGLPLAALRRAEAVEAVLDLVRAGRPSYVITASSHYAMLSAHDPRLREVNARAALIVADGKPLVWASRLNGAPLPERVAGSDMIFDLCARSAQEGFRVFLLGAAEGVAEEAAARLTTKYPGLVVAGTECPPFRPLSAAEHAALIDRVRATRPDILFLAFGQPKGEFWLAENAEALGVPVSIQIGASLDFAAGRFRRAPRWMQKTGMEWAYRMWQEPRRLVPRYVRNARFLAGAVAADLARAAMGRRSDPGAGMTEDRGQRKKNPSADVADGRR
jgi:N-acetylglucosaminyldiphosphoundecaprenol N-acetyl-beta-D-mannosaminyltransferase